MQKNNEKAVDGAVSCDRATTDEKDCDVIHDSLQSSPVLLNGLSKILEKSHWGVKNPFSRYSRENGVHMSMLGEDLVVGFRGTATIWDVLSDLRFGTEVGPHGVRVHRGFHRLMKKIHNKGSFLEEIREAVKANGARRVLLTGYSMGGAVASLFLLKYGDELLAEGIDVRCVTFGSPRLADKKDLKKLPRKLTTRIVHTYVEGDPIPLSLTSFAPWCRTQYVHVGHGVVIRDKGIGVSIYQSERQNQTPDSSIKWWGFFVSPWSHHLTESYERFLQLTALQMNFQLVLQRTPNFLKVLMKCSSPTDASESEDVCKVYAKTISPQDPLKLRSQRSPIRSSSIKTRTSPMTGKSMIGATVEAVDTPVDNGAEANCSDTELEDEYEGEEEDNNGPINLSADVRQKVTGMFVTVTTIPTTATTTVTSPSYPPIPIPVSSTVGSDASESDPVRDLQETADLVNQGELISS